MAEETMTLAPAAGAGIGKVLADKLLADPEFVGLMVAAAINGLKATRSYWTGKGETAELITEADSKTQLQAFALIMAHMEGEPIKRIIHQHLGGALTKTDLVEALQESPALADAVERTLANAKHRQKNPSRAQKAAAIEAEAGEDLDK